MKCWLSNSCEHKYLCCNFCNNKKCPDRCHGDFENCQYSCTLRVLNEEDEKISPRKDERLK